MALPKIAGDSQAETRADGTKDNKKIPKSAWADRRKVPGTEPHRISCLSEDQVKDWMRGMSFWKAFLKFY